MRERATTEEIIENLFRQRDAALFTAYELEKTIARYQRKLQRTRTWTDVFGGARETPEITSGGVR